MTLMADGGGGGGFGFEVPTGDPGSLEGAATAFRGLGLALVDQGSALATASETALGTGGWSGTAASSFASRTEEIIGIFQTNAGACHDAATALSTLSHELQTAQTAASQALADCQSSQSALITHQNDASQAGQQALTLRGQAAAASDPVSHTSLSNQATSAEQAQTAATNAANRAQGDLTAAQARGQNAVSTYEQQAQAAIGQLQGAQGAFKPAPKEAESTWLDDLVTWAGHSNDFFGAGAVGVAKGYDQAITYAARALNSETADFLANPAMAEEVFAAFGPKFAGQSDPLWSRASAAQGLADSPLTSILTKGLPEDKVGLLGRVPYLGWALTGLDMYMNRDKGMGSAVVEPLANLAIGTTTTELAAPVVATGVETVAGSLAAGDGVIATLAGTAAIPGVGEVVIVGAVSVGVVYGADKLGEYVWEHRQAIGHFFEGVGQGAVNDVKGAVNWVGNTYDSIANSAPVHTAEHVVHDLEPWNW